MPFFSEPSMNRILLPALLILTACGTPQENCIHAANRDARVVDQLIAETEANLARGYAVETVVKLKQDWVDCTRLPTEEKPNPKPKMCLEDVPFEVTQPVALDLNAERAKLTSLRQQQARQYAQSQTLVAQCQAQFPE